MNKVHQHGSCPHLKTLLRKYLLLDLKTTNIRKTT